MKIWRLTTQYSPEYKQIEHVFDTSSIFYIYRLTRTECESLAKDTYYYSEKPTDEKIKINAYTIDEIEINRDEWLDKLIIESLNKDVREKISG